LLALGVVLKATWSPRDGLLPYYFTFLDYFTFLVIVALLPAAFPYGTVKDLVNWQTLVVLTLYVVATWVVWEVTLAIPRRGWGYRPEAMLGKMIEPWTPEASWPCPI